MSTEQQIRERIDLFVSDLQDLLVEAARESLFAALGGGAPASRQGQRGTRTRGKGRSVAAKPSRRATASGRVRRSADELADVQNKVVALLGKKPGLTSEEIQEALGIEKKELQRPLVLLRDERRLKTKGQKRGMKYYAA